MWNQNAGTIFWNALVQICCVYVVSDDVFQIVGSSIFWTHFVQLLNMPYGMLPWIGKMIYSGVCYTLL